MTKKTEGKGPNTTGRRDFLKLAATSGPVAAVALATGATQAEAQPADPTSNKIQDTAHTRAYLDSARF